METDSNGLYYMRARYYNQDIKVEDIGSSQSLNRYAYCEGNPVSLVDPFGLSPESTQDQGKTSKYEKLHNLLGTIGIFFDGADLINGFVYLAEKDYVNAAISFACGIPAVGTVVTAVAKTAKLVKYATKAAKITKTCRDIGRIGNAAAGMKALYDTYQTAERECETTGEKIAYIAGTVITGYLVGKYNKKRLKQDTVFYRAGEKGNPLGQWFTREAPESAIKVRIDTAVKPQWIDSITNEMTGHSYVDTVYAVKIPKGTTIYEGPVGYQGDVYLGGENIMQTFIPEPWKLDVEIMGETPLN